MNGGVISRIVLLKRVVLWCKIIEYYGFARFVGLSRLRGRFHPGAAEELFQDVWMNVIRARSSYRVSARFAIAGLETVAASAVRRAAIAGETRPVARVVDLLSKKPQVQERLTQQVADLIETELDSKGVAVIVSAGEVSRALVKNTSPFGALVAPSVKRKPAAKPKKRVVSSRSKKKVVSAKSRKKVVSAKSRNAKGRTVVARKRPPPPPPTARCRSRPTGRGSRRESRCATHNRPGRPSSRGRRPRETDRARGSPASRSASRPPPASIR